MRRWEVRWGRLAGVAGTTRFGCPWQVREEDFSFSVAYITQWAAVYQALSKPAELSLPSERAFSNAGAAVHLVDTVAAADGRCFHIRTHQGPAIEITALRSGLYDGGDQKLFRAYSALDFYITDGSSKIRVRVPEMDAWSWMLRVSHAAYNIMRDETGTVFMSGGQQGEHRKIEPRPDGYEFWDRMGRLYDPVQKVQKDLHSGEDIQQPREALERTLQLGDAVAVYGVLGRDADSGELTLSPLEKKKGAISNNPSVAGSLRGYTPVSAAQEEVRVIALGKHKKAKSSRRNM